MRSWNGRIPQGIAGSNPVLCANIIVVSNKTAIFLLGFEPASWFSPVGPRPQLQIAPGFGYKHITGMFA